MKAIGIAVIVYGHVAHATTVALTPPVYLKQFGVTLFVFVTGFTLAGERRAPRSVVLARLFPIYFYGSLIAALIAIAAAATGGGFEPTNALPFLAGVNVIFDHFPANPSTWYVGTYLHLLLLWAVLFRRVPITPWTIAAVMAIEIGARALLDVSAGLYVGYMAVTSWLTVFLLGMRYGAQGDAARRSSPLPFAIALVAGVALWARACLVDRDRTDVSVHDGRRRRRPDRRVHGLHRRVVALLLRDAAGLRSRAPAPRASDRPLYGEELADRLPRPHAGVLHAESDPRSGGLPVRGARLDPAGDLRARPGTDFRRLCRLAPVDAWRARLLGGLGGLAESSVANGVLMSRRSIS
jgi:hypothetical protein